MRVVKERELAEETAASMRQNTDLHGVRTVRNLRVFRALASFVRKRRAELSKDRATYGRYLVENFSNLGDALSGASDFILTENGTIPSDLVADFGSLFEFWNFAVFQPLADNLTYDEEEGFRTAMGKVREGWRLFLGVCRLKFPDKIDELTRGEALAIACTDFVEDFFLGEIETELTDDYNAKSVFLHTFLDKLKGYFE